MRVRGKTKLLLTGVLVCFFGGTALALYFRPQERLLLPRATRIANISCKFPYYWWLSDHEVLLFANPAGGDWNFVRLDEITSRRTPIERLTNLFSGSGGKPDSVQVSPDGVWMLWSGSKGETVVSKTDGQKHFEYPPGQPGEKRWMCDGRRWIELVHDESDFTGAILHDVNAPKVIKKRPLVPTISCSSDLVNVQRMAPTTDEHILVSLWNGHRGNVESARILALVLNAHIMDVGKFNIHPPLDASRGELIFAPMQGYLAWTLEYDRTFLGLAGERRIGLWVTNMDGWQSREIGSLEITNDGKNGSGPLAVQWSPDGSRLSFVHRDALWAVPVT